MTKGGKNDNRNNAKFTPIKIKPNRKNKRIYNVY